MLNIKVKGQYVHSSLEGNAKQLMLELIQLNICVIDHIVKTLEGPYESELLAKIQVASRINTFVIQGIKRGDIQSTSASDLTMDAWGLDMDAIQLELMTMQELINKWLPIMDEHKSSNTEMTVRRREVKEAGFTMEQVIDKMIDIKTNKEVK